MLQQKQHTKISLKQNLTFIEKLWYYWEEELFKGLQVPLLCHRAEQVSAVVSVHL